MDLEEQNDLARNPEYASVVERLAATLDAELAANDAEAPYLNPAYSENDKASARIASLTFQASNRRAQLSVENAGPVIKEAYVIYRGAPKSAKKRQKGRNASENDHDSELLGMKQPATIAADEHSVSAVIPVGIPAYSFLLVDANHFLQYSELQVAK